MEWLKSRLRTTRAYPKFLQLRKIPFYLRDRLSGTRSTAQRFCMAPWREAAVMCDGTVVCSCADAFKTMPLGNVEHSSFRDIWLGTRYQRLRKATLAGAEHTFLCSTCCFLCDRPESPDLRQEFPLQPDPFPKQLNIEPTVRCNLRCTGCGIGLAELSRTKRAMPFETFARVLDELGPHLEQLNFYHYGEAFLHPRAGDMLRYARETNPNLYIVCSTNGHGFRTPEKCRAIIEAGVDKVIFSVDGASQAVYERYRVGGRFNAVLDNMARLSAMKREMGSDRPLIQWRCILFNWNDSDEEMARARELARNAGADELRWLLTDHPVEAYSRRFAPGAPDLELIRHELD